MKKLAISFLSTAFLIATLAALPALGQEMNEVHTGEPAPGFTLTDTYGNEVSLSDYAGQYVVLEWLNYDCPFVRKHYQSGNMQQLQEQYTERDVVWLAIVSSRPGAQGHFPPDEMNARSEQEGTNATAVLIDESGDVGRLYGAVTTPQMYVIDPEGTLVYNGAIDDQPSPRPESLEGATNFVVAAFDALFNGQQVDPSLTQPYGCRVHY